MSQNIQIHQYQIVQSTKREYQHQLKSQNLVHLEQLSQEAQNLILKLQLGLGSLQEIIAFVA